MARSDSAGSEALERQSSADRLSRMGSHRPGTLYLGLDGAAKIAPAPAEQVIDDQISRERELALAHCKKHNQLFIDDLGFDMINSELPPSVAEAMSDEELEKFMSVGSHVDVFYRNQKPREMYIRLTADCRSILVLPSKESREDAKDAYCETLRDVLEVRKGQKTTAFERFPQPEAAHKSFSLIWGFRREVNVVAHTNQIFDMWVTGLIRLISKLKLEDPQVYLVAREWYKLFGEKTVLTEPDITFLLRTLNAKPKSSLLKNAIKEIIAKRNPPSPETHLAFDEFVYLLRILRQRPSIVALFSTYNLFNGKMPAGEFWKFLQREQMEEIGLEEATELMLEFADPADPSGLTFEQFSAYLTSPANSPLDPNLINVVHQDMTQPLSHYYISSSHNTYLETNQLTGTSSVDMYIRVLKTGCRCIELDCWDGSDGIPMITHGGTLTSTIRVFDVLCAIRDWGFAISDYPLVLSLELHLGKEQQLKLASLLRDILGDLLATDTPALLNPDAPFLPSPHQLRGKILLKGPQKLEPALSELIYLKGAAFKGFSASKSNKVYEMSSFPENDVKKLSRTEFVQYNYRFLSRSYPKGTRFDSSNFDPFPSWNAGIQMVALNYQSQGPKLWAEQGKFLANGGCGYVLKPFYMRQPDNLFDVGKLSKRDPCELSRVHILKIRVLSARQCPKPKEDNRKITDPAIELTIEGIPTDCKTYRTRRVTDNGFSPEWNKEFMFRFALSDMAVLIVSIYDDHLTSSTRLAYAAFPVDSLRPGYRLISFNDCSGQLIPFCDLFVYISMNKT